MNTNTNEDIRFSVSSGRLSSELSSRRLSSEMSFGHLSLIDVYYGDAPVAVPFKWESQPGTPRVRFCETPLPPLTPPPSFLFKSPNTPNKKVLKPKAGILRGVLPRLTLTRKTPNPPVSPASSHSSSFFSRSSYSGSSCYTPSNHRQIRRRSFEDQDAFKSPVSTLCFRIRRGATPKPTRPRSK